MKVIKITVDILPKSCGECPIRSDNYCKIKALSYKRGQSWVDRHADNIDKSCPLKKEE
jgi:hypothetical protein